MTYFKPTTITRMNARAAVDDAYRAAGMTPPTIVDALDQAIAAEPSPYELAVEYANRALDGTNDPDTLIEEATERITRAQALEQFRDVYARTVEQLAYERIGDTRAQAAADLAPALTKLAKQLAKHATQLDPEHPLDKDRAFETDASTHWRAATDALAHLSAFVFAEAHSDRINPLVARSLQIVNIPDVAPERYAVTGMGVHTRIPDEHTPRRWAIRKVLDGLRSNPDETLVLIARGTWPEISLTLCAGDEHARRVRAAENAVTQVRARVREAVTL